MRVKYKEAPFLFDGDAETESDPVCEAEVPVLVDFFQGTNLVDVDVYKVGHHGSTNGTDEEFMQAISPQISVISAGIHTQHGPGKFHAFQFGHPRENIVALLQPMKDWRSAWRSLRKAAGLDGLRFHDGRHLAITAAGEKGVPEQTMLALFGQIDQAMLKRYSHTRRRALEQAANALQPAFCERVNMNTVNASEHLN